MIKKSKIPFDDWYSDLVVALRGASYNGPIDKHAFAIYYDEGKTAQETCDEYIKFLAE